MTNSFEMRASAPAVLLSFLMIVATCSHAQTPSPAKSAESERKTGLPNSPPPAKINLTFKSVFEHYQPYKEQKISGWKDANDEVGRIGGWRTYLKEANEPTPSSTAPTNPHAGHGRK
jgi:hypothetical protein